MINLINNALLVEYFVMVQRQADQPHYLSRYLSLAPVLAILAVSIAFSTWAFFQYFFPDLLLHPMP